MRRLILVSTAIAAVAAIGAVFWLVPDEEERKPVPIAAPPLPPPPPIAAATLKGGAGGVLQVANPDSPALSEAGLKGLREFAARTGTRALLVWQAGALQLEYYDPAQRPGDRLEASGLLPGLLAMLTGIAVKDGSLPGIDDPVSRYLPEWQGDSRGRVTIRHLLEGSSGLEIPSAPPGDDPAAWTLSARLVAEPGTRFAPGAYEAQLLGLVLARARGQKVADYLSQSLWLPMGARDAGIDTGSKTGEAYLHCCVTATARDWLRPGLLLLEDGAIGAASVVPKPWLDMMERPNGHSRNDGWRVRLGWPFDRNGPLDVKAPFVEGDTIFLGGEDGSRLYVSKGRELVILRLGPPVADWDEAALPNMVAKAITTPPAELRSQNGMKVQRARDLNGRVEMPPITKPPAIPRVTVEPLEDAPRTPEPIINVPVQPEQRAR